MTTQKEYQSFRDDKGQINNYKAYLRDLFKEHTIPVLVAEVGIPASRGTAHQNPFTGFDQGKHNETEQGQMVKSLLEDIYDEGYCGGLVFSWQDEWFKRTWNTMELDLPDTRPYWSNPQTNEQEFGLLAFDPGKEQSVSYVDGNIDEWNADDPTYISDQLKLFIKSDEKYVYLMAQTKDYDFDKDFLFIPIDTIPGQGNIEAKNIEIKIPWQLLNVMDPSTKTIMGDFYKNQAVKGQKTDRFYFGAGIVRNGMTENAEIGMEYYTWQTWVTPTYHERLKPSYYILKDAFKALK